MKFFCGIIIINSFQRKHHSWSWIIVINNTRKILNVNLAGLLSIIHVVYIIAYVFVINWLTWITQEIKRYDHNKIFWDKTIMYEKCVHIVLVITSRDL